MKPTDGRWALWSRGTNPKPWTQWQEQDIRDFDFEQALNLFMRWKLSGQHVRLEWLPSNVAISHGIIQEEIADKKNKRPPSTRDGYLASINKKIVPEPNNFGRPANWQGP